MAAGYPRSHPWVPVSLTLPEMVRPGGVLQDQSGTPGRFFYQPRSNKRSESPDSVSRALCFCRRALAALRAILAGIGVIGSGALHIRPATAFLSLLVGKLRHTLCNILVAALRTDIVPILNQALLCDWANAAVSGNSTPLRSNTR